MTIIAVMLKAPYRRLSSKKTAMRRSGMRADRVTSIKFVNSFFSFISCPPKRRVFGSSFKRFSKLGTKEEKEILTTTRSVRIVGAVRLTKGRTRSK